MARVDVAVEDRDRNVLAVMTVILSAVAFSFGDALVKFVSLDLGLWQILFLRAAIAVPLLVAVCLFRRRRIPLTPVDGRWTTVRSTLMILMWLLYYVALLVLPVSVAGAVYFTMPIFVTLLAALTIGEKISVSGWMAVMLGFCGVLLIIRPDSGNFSGFVLIPLAAAFLFAVAMIITRTKLRNEHPYALTINLQIGFLVVGLLATVLIDFSGATTLDYVGPFFGGEWQGMGGQEWFIVLILAIAITLGNIGTSVAYQVGRSSIVATFSFSYIPFVTVWGFLFFAEFPDMVTIGGIILIIGRLEQSAF